MKDAKEIKEKVFQNEVIKTLLSQLKETDRAQTIQVMDQMVDEMNKKFDILSLALTKTAEKMEKK
jgi:hypothetical protein